MKKRAIILAAMALSLTVLTTVWADEAGEAIESDISGDYIPDLEPPEIFTSGDYHYYVNEDGSTVTITEYTGDGEVVEIPSEMDGYRVTDIGDKAFIYREMRSLFFPDSVRSIENRAFDNCVITDRLELPEGCHIWLDAFCYAELPSEIEIPSGAVVEDSAFSYCDTIKKVSVGPDTDLKSRAFSYCDNLEEAVCASGCRLEKKAFEYCRKMKKVTLCGPVEMDGEAFSYCGDYELVEAEESDYGTSTSGEPDLSVFLTGGKKENMTGGREVPEGEHSITLTGEDYVFVDCPDSAKTGETVIVHTVGVCDGEVRIEVNGSDTGTWEEWGTYTFAMPDEDVILNGWISTEGYPGA